MRSLHFYLFLPLASLHDDLPHFPLTILGIFRLEISQIKEADNIFLKVFEIRKLD